MRVIASLLAANRERLLEEIASVIAAGADGVHLDVMDGTYTPYSNAMDFDWKLCRSIRQAFPDLYLEVHLMVDAPELWIPNFCKTGVTAIVLHTDVAASIASLLLEIRAHKIATGVALNPGWQKSQWQPYLELADFFLIMGVAPGRCGQVFLKRTVKDVGELSLALQRASTSIPLIVDGGVTSWCVSQLASLVSGYVVGTALFHATCYGEAVARLRAAACAYTA